MNTIRKALFLTGSLALLALASGCGGGVVAQNDGDIPNEKLQPPSLQPAGAPPARANLTPPPVATKAPSPPPAKSETRTETRQTPRTNGSGAVVAQGPARSEPTRQDGNSERRDRDRERGPGRRGDAREGPGGNSNGFRINISPGGRDSRGAPGGGNRMIVGGEDRGGPERGGPERGAGFGAGFGGNGFGGETARKFKTTPMPDTIPSWFKENDKDGDGQVAMFEWPKDRLDEFNKYDRNGDGFVTIAEAMHFAPKPPAATASNTPANSTPGGAASTAAPGSTAIAPAPGAPLASGSADDRTRSFAQDIIRRSDGNSDGKLDQRELQNMPGRLRFSWQQYDANRDNMLDVEEVTAYLKAQSGGFGGGGFGGGVFGGGGGFGGGGDPRGSRGGNDNPEERMRRFLGLYDRNNDGKISRDEFPRFFPAERFDEMDTNRDGQIDVQEFAKGMEGMRGRFGGFGGGGPGGGGGSPGGFGGRGRGP